MLIEIDYLKKGPQMRFQVRDILLYLYWQATFRRVALYVHPPSCVESPSTPQGEDIARAFVSVFNGVILSVGQVRHWI